MATKTEKPNATSADPDTTSNSPLPLPAPPSEDKPIELNVSSGQGVQLDHLGPMVVNRDGTLSRIANWEHMTEIERRNTVRILGKRNQLRMESLQAEEESKASKDTT